MSQATMRVRANAIVKMTIKECLKASLFEDKGDLEPLLRSSMDNLVRRRAIAGHDFEIKFEDEKGGHQLVKIHCGFKVFAQDKTSILDVEMSSEPVSLEE